MRRLSPSRAVLIAFVISVGGSLVVSQMSAAQQFEYRTFVAGLGSAIGTNGVAVADFNGNGLPDIYFVVAASTDPDDTSTWSRLFYNRGDGTFGLVTPANVLAGADSAEEQHLFFGNKVGASWGDFDNDGYPDLFLTHAGPNQLLRNNGDGTFTDVTATAGFTNQPSQYSTSALWFDYNNSGYLDLYVSALGNPNFPNLADRINRLYRNLGNGQFEEVTEEAGVGDTGYAYTTVALDVSGNGFLDLYVANDFGLNALYINNGDGSFTEAAALYGVEKGWHGMGIAVADISGNEFLDIYLTNIGPDLIVGATNPLFLNTGEGHFIDGAVAAGVDNAHWAWGAEFFDATHNGYQDLVVVAGRVEATMPNSFFLNVSDIEGKLTFEEIGAAMGLDAMPAARSVAILDYDGDGDLDVLVSNLLEPPGLFQNQVADGNWLQIDLEGTVSNRNAFGSTVEVVAGGRVYRRYHHGAQFLAQNILPVHVGLDNAEHIQVITVRWPSGAVDIIEDVAVNQRVLIREKEGLVVGVYIPSEVARGGVRILGNYPNPFSHGTTIRYSVERPSDVTLEVFDILGRMIHKEQIRVNRGGEHAFTLNPEGRQLAGGIYIYLVSAGEYGRDQGRMTVVAH